MTEVRTLSRVDHHECHRATVRYLADIAALKAQVKAFRDFLRGQGYDLKQVYAVMEKATDPDSDVQR